MHPEVKHVPLYSQFLALLDFASRGGHDGLIAALSLLVAFPLRLHFIPKNNIERTATFDGGTVVVSIQSLFSTDLLLRD